MYLAVIYGAFLAIYNIIVLLLFNDKNAVFWSSYAFFTAATLLNVAIAIVCFNRPNMQAVFMGIPLFSISVFYMLAELFAGFVFMLFRNVAGVKLAVAVQAVMLLIFIIVAALALVARNATENVVKDVDTKSKTIKLLAVDVQMLEQHCPDAQLKTKLHKLYEAIYYSDPMTNEFVADLDTLISSKVHELKMTYHSGNLLMASQVCDMLLMLVSERKQKLILSK